MFHTGAQAQVFTQYHETDFSSLRNFGRFCWDILVTEIFLSFVSQLY